MVGALIEEAIGCGPLRRQRAAAAHVLEELVPLLDPYKGRAEQPGRITLIDTVQTFVEGALRILREDGGHEARERDPLTAASSLASFAGAEAVAERLRLTLTPEQRVHGAAIIERNSRVAALARSTATAANLLRHVDVALGDRGAEKVWPSQRRRVLRDGLADALKLLETAATAAGPTAEPVAAPASAHRKLVVQSTPFGQAAYADLYFGSPGAPAVLWLGGAVDELTYERRRSTAPDAIARELPGSSTRADRATRPMVPFGKGVPTLLVVSPPPRMRSLDRARARDFLTVLEALLAEGRLEPETVGGIVGNSLGAHLGLLMAPSLAGVDRVATLAGVGMLEAVEIAGLGGVREIACFSTYDDPVRPQTLRFVDFLAEQRMPSLFVSRPGGHAFDDYVMAGAVREALAWVS